jgi:hypothetical protein
LQRIDVINYSMVNCAKETREKLQLILKKRRKAKIPSGCSILDFEISKYL